MNITDEAVEAACNYLWYERENGNVYEDEVRGALEAAAPHFAKQVRAAYRDGLAEGDCSPEADQ